MQTRYSSEERATSARVLACPETQQLLTESETCEAHVFVGRHNKHRSFAQQLTVTSEVSCLSPHGPETVTCWVNSESDDDSKFPSPRLDALRAGASHAGNTRDRLAAADGRE